MQTTEEAPIVLNPAAFLKAYAATHGSPQSVNAVKLWVPMFCEYISKAGGGLSAPNLAGFRTHLVTEGYKPSSVNRAIGAVRGYLKYLRLRGDLTIDSELVSLALPPAKQARMVPVVLTKEEIGKLCDTDTPGPANWKAVKTFLALGLLTGMRPGEILRCKPSHHQPARGLLVYATKTGNQRCIPTSDNPELAMLLSGAGHGDEPYCVGFSTRHWDALCKAALGRTLNRKVLRSTHSSYLASSGKVSEFEYCSRLGHGLEVANEHYRSMIQGVTGDTVAQWLGAASELQALVRRIVS